MPKVKITYQVTQDVTREVEVPQSLLDYTAQHPNSFKLFDSVFNEHVKDNIDYITNSFELLNPVTKQWQSF